MASQDSFVVTGYNFEQIKSGNMLITPFGGSQTTLGLALSPSGGIWVPKSGGTMTGALVNTAAGTGLSITNNATLGGVTTHGSGSNAALVVTPGATTANAVVLTNNGAGIRFGVSSGNSMLIQPNASTSGDITFSPNGTGRVASAGRWQFGNSSFNISATTTTMLFDAIHTSSGSFNASGQFTQWNRIGNVSDATSITATQAAAALLVLETTAAGAAGDRLAIHGDLSIPVTMGAGGGNSQHAVGLFTGQINANQGGTNPNSGQSQGSLFGINPNVILRNGATALSGIIGQELNVAIATGASSQEKIGLQIIKTSSDAVPAGDTDADVAIRIADQHGAPAWVNGLDFGSYLADWAFGASSILIRAIPTNGAILGVKGYQPKQPQADTGIDFSKVQFTTNALRMPGWRIDPGGITYANSAKISTTNAATTFDVIGSTVTAVAIASGGNNYYPNDLVQTADGTIIKITTTSATPGAATAISLVVPGYSTSPPSNPVSTLNGSGSGLTINLTWTAQTTMQIGAASGLLIKFGSTGAWSANGSIATALSSVGPTGSHTTVQEWFTVTNASGVVRYIPAF